MSERVTINDRTKENRTGDHLAMTPRSKLTLSAANVINGVRLTKSTFQAKTHHTLIINFYVILEVHNLMRMIWSN